MSTESKKPKGKALKIIMWFFIITGIMIFIGAVVGGDPDQKAADNAGVSLVEYKKIKQQEADASADRFLAEYRAKEKEKDAALAGERLKLDIEIECKLAIKKQLKIPKSADFSGLSEKVIQSKNGKWVMTGKVSGKNALGAEIPYSYMCVINADGYEQNKTFTIESAKLSKN